MKRGKPARVVKADRTNGNGHRPEALVPASEGLTQVDVPAFRPRPRDWQHLHVLAELMNEDGRITDGRIGQRLGVSKQAVAKMRRKPGVEAWVSSYTNAQVGNLLAEADYRAVMLAIRGSIEHYREVNKRFGRYPAAGHGAAPGDPSAVLNNAIVVQMHN
jgi:hypothetical protein